VVQEARPRPAGKRAEPVIGTRTDAGVDWAAAEDVLDVSTSVTAAPTSNVDTAGTEETTAEAASIVEAESSEGVEAAVTVGVS
jgi:hypothetical protein